MVRLARVAVAVLTVTAPIAGCGDDSDSSANARPTIRIAQNAWSASKVDAALAAILLGEQLGFPVEVADIDENAQWPAIAKGELHACLEVWPSGHRADIQQYVTDQRSVEDGGPLGPVGKIGWYIPAYLLEAHPDLATYAGFKNPDNVALFRTAETGTKGRFLSADPSFVQYDEQIICNLGLDLAVVFAGSEDAVLAQVDAAYHRQEPILFYFWKPHSAHEKYQLAEVALPPYSDACYAKAAAGGIDCDYPNDVLFKIVWSGLSQYAPDAYQLFRNIHYSTEEQTALIAIVDLDGRTPRDAARTWIDSHQSVWRSWIPPHG